MKKSILIVCLVMYLCFFYSCRKYKKGVCETVFIEGKGSSVVSTFKSVPGGASNCSEEPVLAREDSVTSIFTFTKVKSLLIHSVTRSHLWVDKSSNDLGYTEKDHEVVPATLVTNSRKGSAFYRNKSGVDKPGANGHFRELESEIKKLKDGTYTNVIQIQFQGKSVTVQ